MNGVEVLKVEDREQEEVPRVTKAQKRRVRRSNTETGRHSNNEHLLFLNSASTKQMRSLYFICAGQESGPGEGEREPDCRG